MRLSEAMILGDTLRKRDSLVTLRFNGSGEPCGCAIGAGVLAVGGKEGWERTQFFPWLEQPFADNLGGSVPTYWGAVTRRFFRICEGSMTYESLADWVRSVEPSCGDCNQFNCTCVQKMDEPQLQPAETFAF